MSGGHAHGVAPVERDSGDRIGSSFIAGQEIRPSDTLRKPRRIAQLELGRSDVGQIAAPDRIIHHDRLPRVSFQNPQPGDLGDHAIAHESPHAYRSIICAGHRVTHTGIQSPEGDLIRDRRHFLQLGGLAQKREQPIRLAACGGHLIHDAAGGSGHQIFDLLTEKSHLALADLDSKTGDDGLHDGDLESRRGAHPLAPGDARGNENARTFSEPGPALAHQHKEHARNIRRPVPRRILKKSASRLVIDGHA